MATVWEYAQMSDAVYDDNPQVAGWSLASFRPSGSGLTNAMQAAAFTKGGELVFAFKGTSGGRDVIADAKLAAGMNTHQYGSAWDFVQETLKTAGSHVSACGHSLGGAIAQIIGNRARLPFVTFNAPGVGLISRNLDEMAVSAVLGTSLLRNIGALTSTVWHPMQAFRDATSIFYVVEGANFRLGKDIVGCTGVHYGNVIEIPYSGGALDVVAKHKMTSVLAALENSEFRDRPLESVV